jgi:hypothetical protein
VEAEEVAPRATEGFDELTIGFSGWLAGMEMVILYPSSLSYPPIPTSSLLSVP